MIVHVIIDSRNRLVMPNPDQLPPGITFMATQCDNLNDEEIKELVAQQLEMLLEHTSERG